MSAINQFHEIAKSFATKEEQRVFAKKEAVKWAGKHSLGSDNKEDLLLLRHSFVYLPVEDISNFISYLGMSPKKYERELWLGEPILWASLCRMLRARSNPDVLNHVWNLSLSELKTANHQVAAGFYTQIFDCDLFSSWQNMIQKKNNPWLDFNYFPKMKELPLEAKVKVFTVLSATKDMDLLSEAANHLGFEKAWSVIDGLYHEEWFNQQYKERHKQLVEILKEKPVIQIPMDEGLFNIGSA